MDELPDFRKRKYVNTMIKMLMNERSINEDNLDDIERLFEEIIKKSKKREVEEEMKMAAINRYVELTDRE